MRAIVIGAGIIGSAIALELRQRGVDVALIESYAEGGHTSAASAGMVNPFSLTPGDTPALPFYLSSLRIYPEWVRKLHTLTQIDVEWRQEGCLRVALTPADAAHLQQNLEWIHRYEPEASAIGTERALAWEPALNKEIEGVVYLPNEGWVNTERLMSALHRAVKLSGTNLYTGVPVLCIELTNQHVRGVRTAHGVIEGEAIVVAAGAWAGALLQPLGVHTPVEPVRGVILWLGDLPVPVRRILSSPQGYIVPRADGTVLVGATREQAGYDLRASAESYAYLVQALAHLAPPLLHATVLGHTVGLRPDTPDHNPYIGAIRGYEGLYIAAGHAYHGILMAPATALAVADLVLNGATSLPIQPFDPNRFMR
ncbi:MAG: glycine oxidase ThiO [Fimbriimonadales bacterium]|nr:glycine oxidase ThiO [Fimbriimonadales bacterium]